MQHTERELRYLRPAGFKAPKRLIGLPRLGEQVMTHVDVYYHAPTSKGRNALADKRVNVRVRHLGGSAVLTAKRKRAPEGKATVRDEWTESCLLGRPDPKSPLMRKLTKLVDGRDIVPHLVIEVLRRDVHYLSREAGHLVLSEDEVRYADGSVERRIEIEIASGDDALLAIAHREMKMHYPGIKVATRGKYSEAKRRAGNLPGVLDLPARVRSALAAG